MDEAAKQKRILELKQKLLVLKRTQEQYYVDNKIEMFNKPEIKTRMFPNGLRANPKQQELLNAWEDPYYKVFTYTGGNRTGKTTIGVIIAISTVIGKWPWNGKRLPIPHNKPRKVRILGEDWEYHISKVIIPELEFWWPKNRPVKKKKNNQGVPFNWIDELTGSTIEIFSYKQDSSVQEGAKMDLLYWDEPPPRKHRVANARGLVDRQGREIFCMTLLKQAWVHQDVINARNKDGTPDTTVFSTTAEIWDNVGYGISEEGVNQFIKTLTEDEIQARIYGKPSYMSGLVYPMFQRKVHLVDRFEIPLDWPVDIAIDVHPREKQAILFTATSPQQFKYVFHEIFEHGDGKWVGEQIIRTINRYRGIRINRIIIDPLSKGDKNNEDTVFDKVQKVLFAHGYVLETASKDKTTGILEVKTHMKGPNNEPSIFFFNDLVHIIREIEGYLWDEDTQKPCVVGSTVIDTPSGQFPIKDLVGKNLHVYSYSHKHKRIDVKRAYNIRKTGEKKEIWRLVMDRGVLFATPDHKVLLRSGKYCEIKNLKPYDSLMPLYRTIAVDGYSKINPNDHRSRAGASYPSEHRFVWECVYGKIPNGHEIHHKDNNYLNHDPSNLECLSPTEHQLKHIHEGYGVGECVICGKKFIKNRVYQKYCSAKCRHRRKRPRVMPQPTCPVCGKKFDRSGGGYIYCSVTCRDKNFRAKRAKKTPNNHKVYSVGFYGYEDVYNMEVDDNHNFVANGVVVHNCDANDHFCENLYRTILLDTKYTEPDDYEDEWVDDRLDGTTGY